VLLPFPNWPERFAPQAQRVPLDWIPAQNCPLAAIVFQVPAIWMGDGILIVAVLSCASCP
jgi:hypothetical protein